MKLEVDVQIRRPNGFVLEAVGDFIAGPGNERIAAATAIMD